MRGDILKGKRRVLIAQVADQHRGAQGSAAAVKEVRQSAGAFHLQGFGERPADPLLSLGPRGFVFRLVGFDLQGLQGRIVELAAVIPGHDVQMDEILRDHVFRQPPGGVFLHLRGRSLRPGIVAADQVPAVDGHVHVGHLVDAFHFPDHLIDFTQLDPVAPDLDHPVVPAVENQASVLIPGHLVPGMVHPFARPEGILREAFRGFLRQAVVSQGQPGRRHAKLPDDAGLADRVPVLIDQIRMHVFRGLSQGKGAALPEPVNQDRRAGFAGAEKFHHARIRNVIRVDELLAHHRHVFQRQRPVQLPKHGKHLGRNIHARDLTLFKQLPDHVHVLAFRFIGDVHAAPRGQQRHRVKRAGNEAEPGNIQGPGVLRKLRHRSQNLRRVVQHPLPVHHALGPAGGTGGIENVSLRVGIREIQDGIAFRFVRIGRKYLLQDQGGHALRIRGFFSGGDAKHASHVLQNCAHPLPGIFPVDGNRGASGPQHGEQGYDKLLCTRKEQGDPPTLPLSADFFQNLFRQISGAVVHPFIGISPTEIQQGRILRVLCGLLQKLCDDGFHRFSPFLFILLRGKAPLSGLFYRMKTEYVS